MAIRSNHYEVAFEAYLRALRVPYVAVDEQRRALLAESSIKSLDFIVHGPRGARFLVDIKGRRFPSGNAETGRGHRWENWCLEEDPEALVQWEEVFGSDFRSLLVFAYHVTTRSAAREFQELFEFRDRQYAFLAIRSRVYREQVRQRSPSWGTVCLPSRFFRNSVLPFSAWLAAGANDPPPAGTPRQNSTDPCAAETSVPMDLASAT